MFVPIPANAVGPLGGSLGSIIGPFLPGPARKAARFAASASFASQVFMNCNAAGKSNCGRKASLCFIYRQIVHPALAKNIAFSGFSNAFMKQYCLGEPSLKCCKSISGGGCHSAFNEPAPINCEGNPFYGPTYTPGLCLAPCPGCFGCLCTYLAECYPTPGRDLQGHLTENTTERSLQSNGASPFQEYPDNSFHLGRMASYIDRVGAVMSDLFDGDGLVNLTLVEEPQYGLLSKETTVASEIYDFVRFRGCSGFIANMDILESSLPDTLIPVNYRGDPVVRPGDLVDQLPVMRSLLPYFAVARLALDIPQFWLRVDYIKGHFWTQELRQTTLDANGIKDAATELLKYVDYGGLRLLQLSLKEDWPLMTVSVNESLWSLDEPNDEEATEGDMVQCQKDNGRGEAIQLSDFKVSVDSSKTVSIQLQLLIPQDIVVVRFYWDDGSVVDEIILTDGKLDIERSHLYAVCGEMKIAVQLTNDAGLDTVVRRTIDVACPGLPRSVVEYPSVASVEMKIDISKGGNSFGGTGTQLLYFQGMSMEESDFEALLDVNSTLFSDMAVYTTLPDEAPLILNLTIPWNGNSLRFLRCTCRSVGNYIYTYGVMTITEIRIRSTGGDLINVSYDSPTNGIRCARRGNLFEDEQEIVVVALGSSTSGEVVEEGNGQLDPLFDRDGFYFERLPGRYQFFAELKAITSEPMIAPTAAPQNPFAICFSEDSMVEEASKGLIRINELEIGDMVLTALDTYDRVYSFGHRSTMMAAEFFEIHFSVGRLTLSSNHMVFLQSQGAVQASTVLPGDYLISLTGNKLVEKVDRVIKIGAYAPFTYSGIIIVDGVLASNYVSFDWSFGGGFQVSTGHLIAHIFQAPHRLASRLGLTPSSETYTENGISTWVAGSLDMAHWLLRQNVVVGGVVVVPLLIISLFLSGVECILGLFM